MFFLERENSFAVHDLSFVLVLFITGLGTVPRLPLGFIPGSDLVQVPIQ